MATQFEYISATQPDGYNDQTTLILRESVLASGLIVTEEVGRLDYGDVKELEFPEGLIRPTEDEIRKFGGDNIGDENSSHEMTLGEPEPLTTVRNSVTAFVTDAIMKGRHPILAWTDEANEAEIDAFKEAAAAVKDPNAQESGPEEVYGQYL